LVRDSVVCGATEERESGVSIRRQSGDLDGAGDELIRIGGNGKLGGFMTRRTGWKAKRSREVRKRETARSESLDTWSSFIGSIQQVGNSVPLLTSASGPPTVAKVASI
jgi:hypothetical protein